MISFIFFSCLKTIVSSMLGLADPLPTLGPSDWDPHTPSSSPFPVPPLPSFPSLTGQPFSSSCHPHLLTPREIDICEARTYVEGMACCFSLTDSAVDTACLLSVILHLAVLCSG